MKPVQPVNEYLDALREEWDMLTLQERIREVRASLLFIADPVSQLTREDHITLADYTLGELYHARQVLMRLLELLTKTEAGRW